MALDFGIDVSIDLQDVRPAVIIVINEAATPSNVLVVDADSRGECNVTKGSVAVVVIEVARVVGEVGLENIKPSVAVIIGDGNAHSGLFVAILAVGAAGDHRDIGESAVVVVVEEDAGFGVHGDINIGPAVIIKIIGDGSDGIPRAGLRIPDFAETSVKVPSPLLWNRTLVSPVKPRGPHITGTPFH